MPNGHHGPKEEWDRLEAPLKTLDAEIEAFAKSHGLELSSNYHNWPERSLTKDDGVRRTIQIFLNEDELTFSVGIYASQDRGLDRYMKKEFITKDASLQQLSSNLKSWLEQGYKTVIAWKVEDLPFAVTFPKMP
jgi:hypothetical protein